MIPGTLVKLVDESGWNLRRVRKTRNATWVTMSLGERGIEIKYDRWRHTTARGYRESRLSAVMRTQREVVAFLTT